MQCLLNVVDHLHQSFRFIEVERESEPRELADESSVGAADRAGHVVLQASEQILEIALG